MKIPDDDLTRIMEALDVAHELLGLQVRPNVLHAMAEDLIGFGVEVVLAAITAHRRESTARISLAGIIEKIQQGHGRPGVGEAWAIAIQAASEANTVLWTEEIQTAWRAAATLYIFDKFGARKAFEEAYAKALRHAMQHHVPIKWVASIGWDESMRECVLRDGVNRGLLRLESVERYLPSPPAQGAAAEVAAMICGKVAPSDSDVGRMWCNKFRDTLKQVETKQQNEREQKRKEFEAKKMEMITRAENHELSKKQPS